MRRRLFLLVVAFLLCDAAGLESLLISERCTLNDTQPDGTCPPTCLRCACAQPIVPSDTMVATTVDEPNLFPEAPTSAITSAPIADILHVPKPVSLTL